MSLEQKWTRSEIAIAAFGYAEIISEKVSTIEIVGKIYLQAA